MARKKRLILFVTFVDFTMTYDRVPHTILFRILKRLWCGAVILAVLVSMYSVTHSIVGTGIATASVDVRQGSPTSYLLFIIFFNDLIALIKNGCDTDGSLAWLHTSVLMDDTVLLSTSRQGMHRKFTQLNEFCKGHGMCVNNRKTKLFASNCSLEERAPFITEQTAVEWCERYTSDGALSSALSAHAEAVMCHTLKFVSFLKKNRDVPFRV